MRTNSIESDYLCYALASFLLLPIVLPSRSLDWQVRKVGDMYQCSKIEMAMTDLEHCLEYSKVILSISKGYPSPLSLSFSLCLCPFFSL